MGDGTEAFPDLGKHCQFSDCKQLDFLPFQCQACHKVYCLDHRSHISHECPESDRDSRRVVICETCSATIETTGCFGKADELRILETHKNSGDCDPNNKKKKQTCPVKRCREPLTFSNSTVCKACRIKVCLAHRFPADHLCAHRPPVTELRRELPVWPRNEKFLAAFASRAGKDCGSNEKTSGSSVSKKSNHSVKAC